jgi:hypothetical protein
MQPSIDWGVHPDLPLGATETPRAYMPHKTSPASRLALLTAAAALAFGLAGSGCENKSNDELTKAVVSGEKQVVMAGTGTYFGGILVAKVTIGRGIGQGLGKGAGRHSGGSEEDRRTYQDYADSDKKTVMGAPLPPVTLHLILTNAGPGTLSVTIDDFESDLGNFVVDPEVIALAPGQTAEPIPMVSQLGVTSDDIPVTVTLIVAGQKETQKIEVRDVIDKPAAQ